LSDAPRLFGLIPAAGSGARIGGDTPKQYVAIGHQSMLEHSITALASDARVGRIVVVVAREDEWHRAIAPRRGVHFERVGGPSRAESVRNGLRALDADIDEWVLVHDAARPCLSQRELARLIDAVNDHEIGGLLALPLADTLKRARGDCVDVTVAREALWRAQTPQMFRHDVLLRALDAAPDLEAITDESSAVEHCGLHPRLVAGSATNIKVTTTEDWLLAEAILRAQGRIQ
jgi:2-C-methyl-D-erythritol 4-phosphate cytidylyltransferase